MRLGRHRPRFHREQGQASRGRGYRLHPPGRRGGGLGSHGRALGGRQRSARAAGQYWSDGSDARDTYRAAGACKRRALEPGGVAGSSNPQSALLACCWCLYCRASAWVLPRSRTRPRDVWSSLMAGVASLSHGYFAVAGRDCGHIRIAASGAGPQKTKGHALDGSRMDRSRVLVHGFHFVRESRHYHRALTVRYIRRYSTAGRARIPYGSIGRRAGGILCCRLVVLDVTWNSSRQGCTRIGIGSRQC